MTDLTDERLREIAAGKPIPLAVCAATGDPSWAEVRQNAAELLAARAELRRMRAIEAAAKTWMEWGGHCPTCAFVRHREGNPQLSLEMLWDYCDCGWHAAKAALAAKETP